jgi:hypothetical protein
LRQELIELQNFAGGLNLQSDAFHVAQTETADCQNVDFDVRGAVKKREGYTVFNENTAETNDRDFVLPYTTTGGTKYLVVARAGDTNFAIEDDGTGIGLTSAVANTAGTTHDGVVIKGAAYLVNGVDQTAKISGTTESRLGTTLGATGNMPKAQCITFWKNRIFLGNTDTGTNKSRIRYSGSDTTPTDVEYYKSTSFIDVQQDDGDQIQKLIPFLDSLLIFKTSSTWVLRGSNPRDFELVLANPSVGCVAPRTVAAWDKGVIFLSARGVFSFDGSKVTRLSEKIDPAINDLGAANLEQANGVVFQQKYYLFVHELGATSYPDTAYVFDLISGTWTKYRGWNVWHATVWNRAGTEELYAVDAETREAVLRLKSGADDGGSNINAYFTTKWLDFGVPERRKMHRRMYAWFEADGDYNVNVDVQRNYAAANSVSNTVNLNPGGMIWGSSLWGEALWGAGQDIIRARLTGIGTSPAIRVKVYDDSTNPWTFEGLAFVIQPRNLA